MSSLQPGGFFFIRCLEVYEASLFISCYLVFKYNLYDTRKTAVKFTERWRGHPGDATAGRVQSLALSPRAGGVTATRHLQ